MDKVNSRLSCRVWALAHGSSDNQDSRLNLESRVSRRSLHTLMMTPSYDLRQLTGYEPKVASLCNNYVMSVEAAYTVVVIIEQAVASVVCTVCHGRMNAQSGAESMTRREWLVECLQESRAAGQRQRVRTT